jgi:ATP-dependent DNA helicase RecG
MNIRKITKPEAIAIASREESHFFDRKAKEIACKKIQKIAVAFANADGGEFFIGLADDKDAPNPEDRWQGTTKLEDLNGQLQSLFSLAPTLDLRYEILTCDGLPGYVLRVNVDKGPNLYRTTDNTVYQRHGAQSLPISDPDKLAQIQFAKGAVSYEDNILNDYPTELVSDTNELREFLSFYSPTTDPLDFCVNQHLVDYKTWQPRVAGILLFCENANAIIPKKCSVKIARYETKEDDPERDHLASQISIEGTLIQLIRYTVKKIHEIMSSISVWTAEGLKTLSYPPEAIWETIVNAIIHRDYSISDDVQILIYDNRIEVMSPGRLPGYVSIENILDARFSRNPKIVRTLNRYKDSPNKDLGEGLNTTFHKMKEWGLKAPVISEVGNYVKVVLPHVTLATPTDAILKFLQTNDRITNRQAREITGIRSENLVKIEFYKLRDEGFLEMVPELKGSKSAWRLTENGKNHQQT